MVYIGGDRYTTTQMSNTMQHGVCGKRDTFCSVSSNMVGLGEVAFLQMQISGAHSLPFESCSGTEPGNLRVNQVMLIYTKGRLDTLKKMITFSVYSERIAEDVWTTLKNE